MSEQSDPVTASALQQRPPFESERTLTMASVQEGLQEIKRQLADTIAQYKSRSTGPSGQQLRAGGRQP
jgi:hypothetical protein